MVHVSRVSRPNFAMLMELPERAPLIGMKRFAMRYVHSTQGSKHTNANMAHIVGEQPAPR